MIAIDEPTEALLRDLLGAELEQIARDGIIAEAYRTGSLSIGQAARLLGLSINDAYGFMKERGIPVNYTLTDFDADLEGLKHLRDNNR